MNYFWDEIPWPVIRVAYVDIYQVDTQGALFE